MSMAAVLAFPEDKDQHPPSLGTSCHGGSSSRPPASLGFQQLLSGFLCSLGCWGCRMPGDSISNLPRSPCPCGGGGAPGSCECSLAAGGWHVVYTRVCELSQTSQTRIRAELGRNQCSNIAAQGLLEVTQAKQRGRAGVTAPVAFASPYLGFSAVKLVLAPGSNLDFRQQTSLSQAALLLCRAGALLCPCGDMSRAMQVSHLWQGPHLLPISIAASAAASKPAKHDPSWQIGAAL